MIKHKVFVLILRVILCAAHNFTNVEGDFKCDLPDITTLDGNLNITQFRTDFSKISEVKFPGVIGPFNERLICKIKCIDGNWVGPLCSTSTDGRFQPILRECIYHIENPVLTISFKNSTIEKEMNFPHGSVINARCREFGLYKLKGEQLLKCENGEWSTKPPECVPTTLITNFTGDAPPAITYTVLYGSASVEPTGILYVYPESTLYLDCIIKRSSVDPEWTWTQMVGQYTAGWSEDAQQKDIRYRLVLNKMTNHHSDTYTCTTPEGFTNTVVIKVVNVSCPIINATSDELTQFEEGIHLGNSIHFHCRLGFQLNGKSVISCMGTGQWSSQPPTCVQIFCPMLKFLGPHVSILEYNSSFGGRAVFQCSWGYRLLGAPGIECELDGKWSGDPPSCIPIYCPPPLVPEFGRLVTDISSKEGKYPVGDLVMYSCEDSYGLEGETSIVCTEDGYWSHPPPFCVLQSQVSNSDMIYLGNTTLVHIEE